MSVFHTPMEVDECNYSKELDKNVNIVSEWLIKFDSNTLTESDFWSYWKTWVPHILKLEVQGNSPEWLFNDKKVQQNVFNIFEEFICNGNMIEVSKDLTQQNYPYFICRKMFKMGEPTYSCRECRMDKTCLLCVDCFQQSPHKNHKYKMGTSNGGGYCDCGEIEAWKQDAYCQTHKLGLKKEHVNQKFFSRDDKKRAYLVFEYVLHYVHSLLTFERSFILPSDLDSDEQLLNMYSIYRDQEDNYCTVLYSDENHTFEQLVNLVFKFIKCSVIECIKYVSCIFREGRAVVKCADYMYCRDLKKNIEKFIVRNGEKPLKIVVVHSYIITHQIYALELLTWVQNLIKYSECLRAVVSEIVFNSTRSESRIVESIWQSDSALWKSARLHWHKLFVAGIFIDYDYKKEFAKIFIKNYGLKMKDYINDGRDYSFSLTSLGVQLFTVPTLVNFLMTHHDILFHLLDTFLTTFSYKINEQGKMEFKQNIYASPHFKRATKVLDDIHNLLGYVPTSWNTKLRKSFCHAFSLILPLLNYMQNMNTVTRQVDQHIEYEPEWKMAFKLYLKLKPLITKLLLWCGSDRIVLRKVYRMILKKNSENLIFDPQRPTVVRELIDCKVTCINYDVSTEPVSFHLPRSRFLARLHLYLDRYELRFENSKLRTEKQSPVQMIEPVLRVLVLVSQVRAEMWKHNGDSILNQIYMYQDNTECRMEMFDKDIVILQIGASLIDSNEFLIHVLNKFNLLQWAQSDFELDLLNESNNTFIRQTISLVEEFLTLIIIIVGERYTPGVGKVTYDDCIRKEVIQQLCVKPMPYSELNKTLLASEEDEVCLEKVINEVAILKKSVGYADYELKPMYYDDYNVFFYHYSKEKMSKSEEEQRKRRKAAGELECCPPPCLPLFCEAFAKVANIMQCDVMFYIIRLILDRTVNLRSRSFSESQLHKVLHLIGYALHEEEKQQSSSFTFTERSESYGIEVALDELRRSPRVGAHKDLAIWTLNKFKQVSALRRKNEKVEELVVDMEGVKSENIELEKEKRSRLVAERRANVMAQIAQMQNNFMKDNATLLENPPTYSKSHKDSVSMDILENIGEYSIALGPYQTPSGSFNNRYTCILCQEEQVITHDCQAMVLATFVQKSSVLCQVRNNSENNSDNVLDPHYISANFGPSPHVSTCGHVMHVDCWQKHFDMIFAKENRRHYRSNSSLVFDVNINEYLCPLCKGLCNAVMPLLPPISHFAETENMKTFENLTFENWLARLTMTIKKSKVSKPKITEKSTSRSTSVQQITSAEPDRRCSPIRREASLQLQTINNMTQVTSMPDTSENPHKIDDEKEILHSSNIFSIETNNFILQVLTFSQSSPKVVPKFCMFKEKELSTSLVNTVLKFADSIYSKSTDIISHISLDHNIEIPLMTWKACAYTIHSNEVVLRYKNKPLFGELSCRQKNCLEALVRVSGILSSTWKKDYEINLHALRLLSLAIDNGGNNTIGILDWDAFGMLVSLTMTLQSLYYTEVPVRAPIGTMLDFHTLLLMLIVNLVQIILTIDIEEDSQEMLEMAPEEAKDTYCISDLVYKLRSISIHNTAAVWNSIKNCSIPFLRCCCLFYHFLTGIPASGVLTEVNGDTYHNMCCYLGLPTSCKELLDKPYVDILINKWAENKKLIKIKQGEKIPFRVWTHINELVQLPYNYSELLNTRSMLTCPNSNHKDSRFPTMCLVCGAMLCSGNYCCQTSIKRRKVGACNGHAYSCGVGVGIFFRVRNCEVFSLAPLYRGSSIKPPYLDIYGETDKGLKRGNPLYLCKEQYRKLQILWLDHRLHEEISRYLDSDRSYSFNWSLM